MGLFVRTGLFILWIQSSFGFDGQEVPPACWEATAESHLSFAIENAHDKDWARYWLNVARENQGYLDHDFPAVIAVQEYLQTRKSRDKIDITKISDLLEQQASQKVRVDQKLVAQMLGQYEQRERFIETLDPLPKRHLEHCRNQLTEWVNQKSTPITTLAYYYQTIWTHISLMNSILSNTSNQTAIDEYDQGSALLNPEPTKVDFAYWPDRLIAVALLGNKIYLRFQIGESGNDGISDGLSLPQHTVAIADKWITPADGLNRNPLAMASHDLEHALIRLSNELFSRPSQQMGDAHFYFGPVARSSHQPGRIPVIERSMMVYLLKKWSKEANTERERYLRDVTTGVILFESAWQINRQEITARLEGRHGYQLKYDAIVGSAVSQLQGRSEFTVEDYKSSFEDLRQFLLSHLRK